MSLRLFMDTHNRDQGTFPAEINPEAFASFFKSYQEACAVEGVIPLRAHVGFDEGRAFCFTLAPDADAVRRAHERVGLPFDSITEVTTLTPGDMLLTA
ncbi:MAG: DUF4242 domain-containing protein [Alphaproteobacteria bacterium]|nr:DUF4242 domain-containing protein [Alphaproteobacteria bacterium]